MVSSQGADFAVPPLMIADRLNTADRIILATLAVLGSICAATHPEPAALLVWIGLLAAAVPGLASLGTRFWWGHVAHDFSPIAFIIALFEISGPIVAAANPMRWDARLAGLDARWFGEIAGSWRGALGRPAWLTDLSSLAYASFYFVPLVLAVGLYRRGPREEFDRFVTAVLATFVASWLGYLVFPTFGPRLPAPLAAEALGGTWISQSIHRALSVLERNVLDAFPSGHAAVSLVYCAHGWKNFPRWRGLLVIVEVTLLFSTVYLSVHYVTDVVVGAALAGLVLGLGAWMRRASEANVVAPSIPHECRRSRA